MSGENVEAIVACLIKCCGNDNIEIITEALNVFFDVFCDEQYDVILANAGILNLMTTGVDTYRAKILACSDYEIKEHAQEAFENLIEFIKYKAQHII